MPALVKGFAPLNHRTQPFQKQKVAGFFRRPSRVISKSQIVSRQSQINGHMHTVDGSFLGRHRRDVFSDLSGFVTGILHLIQTSDGQFAEICFNRNQATLQADETGLLFIGRDSFLKRGDYFNQTINQ